MPSYTQLETHTLSDDLGRKGGSLQSSSVEAGGSSKSVNKDVVLREFLDVLLKLSKLVLAGLLLLLLPDCVNLLDVGDLLVLLVDLLPLLLERSNKLLALVVGHQELLLFVLVFLLKLHLADHLVLVFDFIFDLLDVLGGPYRSSSS